MGIDRTAHYCQWASRFVHTTEVALVCTAMHAARTPLSNLSACSDVLVMAPRNRNLALLLDVAVSAAPTLNIHNVAILCLMKRYCKTIKYIKKIIRLLEKYKVNTNYIN